MAETPDPPRRPGRSKAKCPRCGPSRKNKHDRSLSLALGPCRLSDGSELPSGALIWFCHHCGWKPDERVSVGPRRDQPLPRRWWS